MAVVLSWEVPYPGAATSWVDYGCPQGEVVGPSCRKVEVSGHQGEASWVVSRDCQVAASVGVVSGAQVGACDELGERGVVAPVLVESRDSPHP